MDYSNIEARGSSKANNLTLSDLDFYKAGLYPDSGEQVSEQRQMIRNSIEDLIENTKNNSEDSGFKKGIVAMMSQFKKWKKRKGL